MFSQFWNSLYTIARRETDYEPKTHDQKPVITSHNQPQVHRFFWWFRSNFKTPTELPHFPPWLKATNKNWNAHPCNMATGYSVRSVWECVHMIECLLLLSLPLGWDWRLWQVSQHSAGQIWSPSWRNPVSPEQRANIQVLQDFRVNVVWGSQARLLFMTNDAQMGHFLLLNWLYREIKNHLRTRQCKDIVILIYLLFSLNVIQYMLFGALKSHECMHFKEWVFSLPYSH